MAAIDIVPSVKLKVPFTPPSGTFSAKIVDDMFFMVPMPIVTQSYAYDIGIPSTYRQIIYSIQNNCTNTTLQTHISSPSYLKLNINSLFSIAPKTIANVVVFFNEAFVKQQDPKTIVENLKFTITPLHVNGPVFVDANAKMPPDLNLTLQDTSSLPPPTTSGSAIPSDNVEIVYVQLPAPPLPPPGLSWKDGTTGQIKPGSPPEGWVIQADGAAYPPNLPPSPCSGSNTGSNAFNDNADVQALLNEIKSVPVATGATRTPIVFSQTAINGLFAGPPSNARYAIGIWIADIGPNLSNIKMQNFSKKTVDGTGVNSSNADTAQYIQLVSDLCSYARSGTSLPSPTTGYERMRFFTLEVIRFFLNNSNTKFPGILLEHGFASSLGGVSNQVFDVINANEETVQLAAATVVEIIKFLNTTNS